MAAKIVFAVLAGLFVAQVVLANPVQLSGSSSSEGIFEKILAALKTFEQKVDNITLSVAEAMDEAVDKVENAALALEEKVESAINDVVSNITADEEVIQNCTTKGVANITKELEQLGETSLKCVSERVEDVITAVKKVEVLREEYVNLLNATVEAEKACAAKQNTLKKDVCALERGVELLIKANALNAKLIVAGGLVAAELAELGPLAAVCTGARMVEFGAEVIESVKSIATCIKKGL